MKRQKEDKIRIQYSAKIELLSTRYSIQCKTNYYIILLLMANIEWDISDRMSQIMNTSELQKAFQWVYKDFFNTHDIVLSGNSILTWWADISHGISVLRMKQKLPIKTFCGANFNTSGSITFWTMFSYSAIENSFKEVELNTFFKQDIDKITWFLQDFLKKNNSSLWVEIDFLSEVPPWHGFAFSWVISVLLTYLLHIIVWKLDSKILIYQEISQHISLFDELYLFSLNLSNCISGGKSIGASNYAVMSTDTALPVVHFSQKCTNNETCGTNIMNDQNTDIRIELNRTLYKNSLLDLLWVDTKKVVELPVDYGVIFTGLEYRFSEIEAIREQKKYEESWLDYFVSDMVRSLPVSDEDQMILSRLLSSNKSDKNEVLDKNIDNMNLRILNWFNTLLKNTHSDLSVDTFIDILKKIGLLSFSYQKENRLFSAIQYLFHQYQQFEDEDIGIFPFNTGKVGGSLFFVMKKWKSQATLKKVLDHLKDNGRILSLDYASWRDWYSPDGVCIDQYISQKIYSHYTKEGDVLFTDTFGVSYCWDYDSIIKKENDCILLDTVWSRIYIKGIKLTSKEIHSQNTTIDMFKLLIENMGNEVSNSKLPVSTYSQNKNEILSKVVLPIKKIAKENFGSEMPLTCLGWITDYFLRLERDPLIRIGIIKKLQN